MLILLFSLFSTTLNSQNNAGFQPFWEFGMQYNYEGNSAFESNSNGSDSFLSSTPTKAIHKMRTGYSWAINAKFNISQQFAVIGYLAFAHRNYTSEITNERLVFFNNGSSSIGTTVNTVSNQTTTYDALEFAGGFAYHPLPEGKLYFSTGLGVANTNNFDIFDDAEDPTINFSFSRRIFVSGTPLFAFLSMNYSIIKTQSARIFIEPHFKMDLVNHNQGAGFKQANYTLGIGVGGSVKIFN